MKPSIDIVIPSYNGKYLLEKHLPEVIKFSDDAGIIVVDDGSCDGTPEYLKEKFPQVICLHHKKNVGFSKSMNIGIRHSKADFIVFLNNDVYPKKGYLEKAIQYFSDKNIFGVSFNEEKSSWPVASWFDGKFQFTNGEDKSIPHCSGWLSGGSAMVRGDLLKKIGSFNEIYSPGYWEDIDLGWRAWKNGYKIVWVPDSHVIHHHESSFSKLNPDFVSMIKQRNELLFIWQNFSENKFTSSHLKFLFTYSLRHPRYLRIIFLALIQYLLKGKKTKGVLSDSQVFALLNKPYAN
ncbi:MAG TPA: glycosyltransferase family 2 protein [Spirochaetia bacterium]|nr:glycosyltransferase family 2 protein [Spirochaetia bacterium]